MSIAARFETPQTRRFNPTFNRHQSLFIEQTVEPVKPLAGLLAKAYAETASRFDYVKANIQLREAVAQMVVGGFNLSSDDEALTLFAKLKAEKGEAFLKRGKQAEAAGDMDALWGIVAEAKEFIAPYGCRLPVLPVNDSPLPLLARVADPLFWRRNLRRLQMQRVEKIAIYLGRVRRGRECYCSDETVRRGRGAALRNQKLLEGIEAKNQDGQAYTLAELAEIFSPKKRRFEMMTRCRGFEEVAALYGHEAAFFTITAPSRFHRYSMKGEGKNRQFFDNPNWKGATPADAKDYLQDVWVRARAALNRQGIRPYGFRVAEVHHDGCIHWHLLLWVEPESMARLIDVLKDYALQDSPDETGAKKHRFTVKRIDPAKGSATGYIAKYIAKNISVDGLGDALKTDLYGNDAAAACERVTYAMKCWRARQFQQIGGPSVGVWRELRRAANDEFAASEFDDQDAQFSEALTAADEGNWCAYVLAMGGPQVKRAEQPLRVASWREAFSFDQETGEVLADIGPALTTKYGETAKGRVFGLALAEGVILTRSHVWTVERIGKNKEIPGYRNIRNEVAETLHETKWADGEAWAEWSIVAQAERLAKYGGVLGFVGGEPPTLEFCK